MIFVIDATAMLCLNLLVVRRCFSPTRATVLLSACVRSLVRQGKQIFLEFCMDMRFVVSESA